MNVFRFANPVHYILESDVRNGAGELVSRHTEAIVLRCGEPGNSRLYCLACFAHDCHHIARIDHLEEPDVPDPVPGE